MASVTRPSRPLSPRRSRRRRVCCAACRWAARRTRDAFADDRTAPRRLGRTARGDDPVDERPCRSLGLLERNSMTGVREDVQLGVADALREHLGVGDRRHDVEASVEDERRRLDAMKRAATGEAGHREQPASPMSTAPPGGWRRTACRRRPDRGARRESAGRRGRRRAMRGGAARCPTARRRPRRRPAAAAVARSWDRLRRRRRGPGS